MNCPKCGASLEDDSKFCVSCGANLEANTDAEETSTDSSEAQSEKVMTSVAKKPKNSKKVIGLVVGTLFIAIGLIRVLTAGTSISSTSFGADFYTYTYRGIVAISEILASIEVTLGWIVVAIGAAIDIISLKD